jgi:epoxyqueuosine reductase
MTYAAIEADAAAEGLDIMGAFHPGVDDGAPDGTGTLILLGPREPGFWARIEASPESALPDKVDRWSTRVIGGLAERQGATALFPFGGPPYQPFVSWALKTGRVWSSPVSLMVHDTAGLFLSFRGALALAARLDLPAPPAAGPCATCAGSPCLSACPARALTGGGYDLSSCHAFLDTNAGADCMNSGCAVRRACPVSARYGRLAGQSAHHMRHFHRTTP